MQSYGALCDQEARSAHQPPLVIPNVELAAGVAARCLGRLPGAWRLRACRGRLARGLGAAHVRHELRVDSHDLEQYLVIFCTTALGFQAPYQYQCILWIQIDLLNMSQEFEESKHHGLHLEGDQAQSIQLIR